VTASEAPVLFRLVEELAASLGASVPDDVFINSDVNASTVRWGLRWRSAIVLGLPLCTAISGQQFVALVGHELAHGVNGDFGRGYIVGTAQQTLRSWAETLNPALELTAPIVVPATTTVRGLPSEVSLAGYGVSGVLNALAAGPVRRDSLVEPIGFVEQSVLDEVCTALAWTTGCS